MFKQIVKQVNTMHWEAGVAHLNLTIENILLNEFFLPQLTDFSYSEKVDTILTASRGTEFRISPEME